MRSRRVLVLRLGDWGLGVDAKSVRSVRKRSPCVRKHAENQKNRRETELSSLLDSRWVFASQMCQQSQGSGGVVVAKRRTVVTFGLAFGIRVSKVSTVRGSGGVLVAKPRSVVTFWTSVWYSRLERVNSHGDGGGPGRETQICRHF